MGVGSALVHGGGVVEARVLRLGEVAAGLKEMAGSKEDHGAGCMAWCWVADLGRVVGVAATVAEAYGRGRSTTARWWSAARED